MKSKSRQYTLLLIGTITLIVAIFGYWYVYSQIVFHAQKHSTILQEIRDNEQSNIQELRLIEISSSTAEKRRTLNSLFVSEDKILDFIKSIENISKDSNTEVVLSGISADSITTGITGETGNIKLHVDIKGNWVNVNKALSLIENLPYGISISTLNLRAYGLDTSSDKKALQSKSLWNMSLDIDVLAIK